MLSGKASTLCLVACDRNALVYRYSGLFEHQSANEKAIAKLIVEPERSYGWLHDLSRNRSCLLGNGCTAHQLCGSVPLLFVWGTPVLWISNGNHKKNHNSFGVPYKMPHPWCLLGAWLPLLARCPFRGYHRLLRYSCVLSPCDPMPRFTSGGLSQPNSLPIQRIGQTKSQNWLCTTKTVLSQEVTQVQELWDVIRNNDCLSKL